MKLSVCSIVFMVALLLAHGTHGRFIKLGIEDTIKDGFKQVQQIFIPVIRVHSTPLPSTKPLSPEDSANQVSEVDNAVSDNKNQNSQTPELVEEEVVTFPVDDVTSTIGGNVTETPADKALIDAPVRGCPAGTISVNGRCKKNFGR